MKTKLLAFLLALVMVFSMALSVSAAEAQDPALVLAVGNGKGSVTVDVYLEGGKGITNYKTERFGKVVSVKAVDEGEDIILINNNGVIIRIAADTISLLYRTAKGVRVMKVADGESVYAMEVSEHSEEAGAAEQMSEADAADNAPDLSDGENDGINGDESDAGGSEGTTQAVSTDGAADAFNAVMENAEKRAEEMDNQ